VNFGVTNTFLTQPVSMAPKLSQAIKKPKNILKTISGALSTGLNKAAAISVCF
jgi:hypothetical protein